MTSELTGEVWELINTAEFLRLIEDMPIKTLAIIHADIGQTSYQQRAMCIILDWF